LTSAARFALNAFETSIIGSLIVMMATVVALSTVELGWLIVKDVSSPPFVLLRVSDLLDIFGLFLLVVIGVELLASLKIYFLEQRLHVDVVLEVALISVARRVILFESAEKSNVTLVALAALLLALAAAHYFQNRGAHRERKAAA
jgi:uncharacterized membrane protein (DUF373 family)